jgi:type II secretory pathway pseudopilin PulG
MTPLRQAAFTLVELVVVLGIIALVMGMSLGMSKRDDRHALVEGAAYELAATVRQTRAHAMASGSTWGISFNIANGVGTSGRVLNNKDGGHWYQVLGPSLKSKNTGYPALPWATRGVPDQYSNYVVPNGKRDKALRPFLDEVRASFNGERHTLEKGRVRFLALSDVDNGNAFSHAFNYAMRFPYTYPRPWFGFWDAQYKRLFPWGGYDHAFRDFRQCRYGFPRTDGAGDWNLPMLDGRINTGGEVVSFSGFYYEGNDGAIPNSAHPTTRQVYDDTNNDGFYQWTGSDADAGTKFTLWTAGEPRPLVNALWLDACLLFYPDGRVEYQRWGKLRHEYGKPMDSIFRYYTTGPLAFPNTLHEIAMGDMCHLLDDWELGQGRNTIYWESDHYVERTGGYFITLAPDAAQDTDVYDSADAALNALFPIFRVYIAQSGEVRVIPVRRSAPAGTEFLSLATDPSDATKAGPGNVWGPGFWHNGQQGADPLAYVTTQSTVKTSGTWQDKTKLFYRPTGPCGSQQTPVGRPATDFVTGDMLANQKWWIR